MVDKVSESCLFVIFVIWSGILLYPVIWHRRCHGFWYCRCLPFPWRSHSSTEYIYIYTIYTLRLKDIVTHRSHTISISSLFWIWLIYQEQRCSFLWPEIPFFFWGVGIFQRKTGTLEIAATNGNQCDTTGDGPQVCDLWYSGWSRHSHLGDLAQVLSNQLIPS